MISFEGVKGKLLGEFTLSDQQPWASAAALLKCCAKFYRQSSLVISTEFSQMFTDKVTYPC